MPRWSRLTCLFGLPDEAEGTDDVVLAAIGPVIRAAAADLVEAPLPAEIAALLAQLKRLETNPGDRHDGTARQHTHAGRRGQAKVPGSQRRRADPRTDLAVLGDQKASA
jgi:hypothetical protein